MKARITAVIHAESRSERLLVPLRPGMLVGQLLEMVGDRSEMLPLRESGVAECEMRLASKDGPRMYAGDDVSDVLRDSDEVHVVLRKVRSGAMPAIGEAQKRHEAVPHEDPVPLTGQPGTGSGRSSGVGQHQMPAVASGMKCIATLVGHSDDVCCVASLPGGLLVSSSYDHTIGVWDAALERRVATMEADDPVTSVACLQGCRIIATTAHMLVVWEAAGGRKLQTLGAGSGAGAPALSCVAVADDRAVTGNLDGVLQVWDVSAACCVQSLPGHQGVVCDVVALAPEGRFAACVASASADGTVRIWDRKSGEAVRTLRGCGGVVYGIAELPGGNLASGSLNGNVGVWDLSAGQAVCNRCHSAAVYSVAAVSAIGHDVIAYGSFDGKVRLWDSSLGSVDGAVTTLNGHKHAVKSVAVTEGPGLLVSGSHDATVRVWAM